MDIHLCSIGLHLCSVSMHSILSTFAFCKLCAAEGVFLTGLLFILFCVLYNRLTRNILDSTWILMSVFAWSQIFLRNIMLNRMYLNVQETTFRTIQILFHCGFLHQKKTQEPNDGHSHHKSKQRGKLGWAFFPCSFPQTCDVWCCISVWVHQLHKHARWLAWQGKDSRLQLPVAPNFPALVVGKPHGSPGEMLLLPCTGTALSGHSYTPSTSEWWSCFYSGMCNREKEVARTQMKE